MIEKDRLFQHSLKTEKFTFDHRTAVVFDDMIVRSVPGYQDIVDGIVEGAADNHNLRRVYDLGCSTGYVAQALLKRIPTITELFAVDRSHAMLVQAKRRLHGCHPSCSIEFVGTDIHALKIVNADLIVLNFTLQFTPREHRDAIVRKCHRGLNNGGLLFLSDKTHAENPRVQEALHSMHLSFKKRQGYSALEVFQKDAALQGVLLSDTVGDHLQRLEMSGFQAPFCWYYNRLFAAFIAQK